MAAKANLRKRVRVLLAVVFILIAIGLVALWRNLLPATSDALPASLSEADRRDLARVCRVQTIRLSLARLKAGEIKSFVAEFPKLMDQRIHRFIEDRDGTCRAYVGYPDKMASDGYGDLWRHQLVKTNGQWQVVRSY